MTRRNIKTEKTELAGAIAFIVCVILIVCTCALVAFVSGDVAAVLVVAILGSIVALMVRMLTMAIAFELIR